MKQKHMGWFGLGILALLAYFVFKKVKLSGGVTATPAPAYSSGPPFVPPYRSGPLEA